MELGWIELIGYRCYPETRVEPAPGVNVFVGDNGSGKTSLLEAIGYLASLASFRRSPDASLLQFGAEAAILRGEFVGRDRTLRVEVELPDIEFSDPRLDSALLSGIAAETSGALVIPRARRKSDAAAPGGRVASAFTSFANAANPPPASAARAASTDALIASMLVCCAMFSITSCPMWKSAE